MKISAVHFSNREEPCQIFSYLHCGQCLKEVPEGQSPETYARLNVGMTKKGIQVWCVRHKCSVDFRVCGAPGYFDVATQLMEKDREGRYMLSHTSHYCEAHGRQVIDSLLNLLHADEDEQEES